MNQRSLTPGIKFKLPYTVSFAPLGSGPMPGWFSGTTWSVSSGVAINTPTLGTELLTNGDMETTASWTPVSCTLAAVADPRTGSSGSNSMGMIRAGSNWPAAYQNVSAVAGDFYLLTGWFRNVDVVDADLVLQNSSGATALQYTQACAGTSWLSFRVGVQAIDTGLRARYYANMTGKADGSSARFDDFSLKRIDTGKVFGILPCTVTDVRVSAAMTIASQAATHSGVVINANSRVSPTNYIIGTLCGATGNSYAVLRTVVGGTVTNLIAVVVSPIAGATLYVQKIGTTYKLYYNGAQVGTDQTITDANLVNNKFHGLFSEHSENTFSSFSIVAL
jgi:hypothetical protein